MAAKKRKKRKKVQQGPDAGLEQGLSPESLQLPMLQVR
jgi:hypothetical protein